MTFFEQLRRRNVLRVGAAYAVGSWLLIQIAETVFPLFGFDETPARIVVLLVAIGFVPTLVLSWVFEWTPEGVRRERETDIDHELPATRTKKFDRLIMAGLALALGYFAFDKFVLEPGRIAEREQKQAEKLAVATEDARQRGRTEALVESFGDHSIAVMPFADMSPEGDQEYLSDGIAEELLNLLSQVPGLRVISRTSAFAFKDQALEVPEIARRLKVGHLLEGSVRKAGNTIRVTAQLIEAHSDTHLWSQTWDRELDDVFAIQDEISAQVVNELKIRLLKSAPVSSITSPEVFELTLKGRFLVSQRTEDDLKQAESLFEQAIAQDARYAPAYAGLAKSLVLQSAFGWTDAQAANARAAAALDRALELDPRDSDALAARGLMVSNTNVDRAREYYKRAIDANPNSSDAFRWLGLSYGFTADQPERYLEYILRGYLVDPLDSGMNMNRVLALVRFGRTDEALLAAREWHDAEPGVFPYTMGLARTYLAAGRITEAIKTCYTSLRVDPGENVSRVCVAGILLDNLQEFDLADAWLQAARNIDPDDPTVGFMATIVAKLRGDRKGASRMLSDFEKRYPQQWFGLGQLNVIVNRDFARAREIWEHGSVKALDDQSPNSELHRIVAFARVMQSTGAGESAKELIAATLERVEAQISSGLVGAVRGDMKLHFFQAALYAMLGDVEQTVAALQENIRLQGGTSCIGCLHGWAQFDGVRGNPAFDALLASEDNRVEAFRRELKAQNLLLTPDEVLSLEDWGYDPFQDSAGSGLSNLGSD